MCVEPVISGGVGTRFAVVSTYSGPRALASFARNGAAALLRPQSEEAFAWHAEQREGSGSNAEAEAVETEGKEDSRRADGMPST